MVLMAIDQDVAISATEHALAPIESEAGKPLAQRTLSKDALFRFTRNRAAVAAGGIFLVILLYCLLQPFFSPYDPNAVDFGQSYLPASWDHPFGTDKFG
jgi:ABC-type dipeptide/oligopeptide/nickel transport system permease subunit